MNNTNDSSSNPSDSLDGVMFGSGTVTGGLNFGFKDSRFDDSNSSSLMFNTNQVNTTINPSPPKEAGIGQMLTSLHLEWRKHETEKCRWLAEKAEYDAKIAIFEGRLKSYANANSELLQRIKMLESALLVARSQKKIGKESIVDESTKISDYQPPKSIYTHEQIKRGRHLLQQYLKEIQTIDEAIQSKGESDGKVVEYLLRTSAGTISSPTYVENSQLSKSGYDSTNYSKTFDHTDMKTHHPAKPMSSKESSKFLDDLKRGLRQSASDRQRDSSSKSLDRDRCNDSNMESSVSTNYNSEDVLFKSSTGPHCADSNNHLFDLLNTLGSYSTNPTNNDVDDSFDIMNFNDNPDDSSSPSLSELPNSMGLASGISSAAASGGVIRKKVSSKKSRMKIDMLNFNDDVGSGTVSVPKKSDYPSAANPLSNSTSTSTAIGSVGNNDLNAAFESKLDILAKRFNVGESEVSGTTSDELASLSSNLSSSVDAEVLSSDYSGIDLGILNDIDSLISSHDDSSNLLTTSNDEIGSDIKSTAIQKHWSINSVLRGHNDSITCVNLHPKDKMAVSSSLDGLVSLWCYNDKQKSDMYPTYFLRGHEHPVLCCLFNTVGDCLYTSDSYGNILVWNVLNNGTLMCQYKAHQEAIWYLNHNHSTNTLLSASADGVLSLWKPDSTNAVDTYVIENSNGGNQMGVISADFLPSDHSKIVISAGDAITVYDVNSRKNVFELRLGDNYIPTMSSSSGLIQSSSIHPSINIYATGWGHNQVRIVDLTSAKFVNDFIAHPAPITALSFGNGCSGTFLATAGANGSIHMWSSNYSCYQDVPPHRVKHHSGVNSLCFHSTYPHMVTGGADELVKLYI